VTSRYAKNDWGFERLYQVFRTRRSISLALALTASVLFSGCHGDPNVRKHKYLESGERYSAKGKYREAAIQYLNAIKIDKNYAAAHYDLAQAYMHLGQFGVAYKELQRAVDLQPGDWKARIDLGKLDLAGGKIDDAQVQANVVLAAQPNNPDLHALLSAIAARQGHKDQALAELHRALELDPNRAAFHEDLALLQADDTNALTSVEAELKKAIALDPKSVNAKLLLVAFYSKAGRWAEAEQAARDAIATDPNDVAARQGQAQVYLLQGNQAKAEEVLRQSSAELAGDPQGAQLLAAYYERSGQNDKAKTEYARLADKYPKNLSVQEAYVRALIRAKDYSTAQTAVARLLKSNPKDAQIQALHGIVLLNDGKAGDAVNVLAAAAKDYPNDGFIQYWLGKSALAKGDNALAETSFQHAVQINSSAVDALEQLGGLAVRRNDMNLLADVSGKMIAAAPKAPQGYVWRAITEGNRGEPDQAEADLRTAIALAPKDPTASIELGRLMFEQKRGPAAEALFEQALQADPTSVAALRALVSYELSIKQPQKAMERVNTQIAKSPGTSGFLDLLCQLQIQAGSLDQAASTAQKAIQMDPKDGEAVMLFTQLALQRGQTASAIGVWEQWLGAHPNDAGTLAVLGMLEESRGNLPKAEGYYRKSLEIQPQQPVAANNLAYRMLEDGQNVDVALTLAQTARQGMPDSPTTADTLAWAYYHKGAYAFARDLLEGAVKSQPGNATLQYHLGMVYSRLQDKPDSLVHLKRALSLAPGSPTAKDAEAALQGNS
jgi:tetratricopeptide (TPR) repeat protein